MDVATHGGWDVVMDDAWMDAVMRGLNRGLKMLAGQPFSSGYLYFSEVYSPGAPSRTAA